MNPRPFAYFAGILLLLLAVLSMIPPLTQQEDDPLRIAAGVGGPYLFGLFPVSIGLSIIHGLLGAWALYSARRLGRTVRFARAATFIFGLLLVMGTIPGADELFGIAPLYGNNLLVHGVLALLSFMFGWLYRWRSVVRSEGEAQA